MPDVSSGSFADHFSTVAAGYARYRPTYPTALFDWIAAAAPARDSAWDCGCGNGQATVPLAERFARVIGTDPSADQIAQAPRHPRIDWRVATAESSGLDPASVAVVTVAQALHWFDLPRFWAEVRRVVRPGGLVAVWTYGLAVLDDAALAQALRHLHDDVVGPYWPKERGHVDQGYQTLPFPFDPVDVPAFDIQANWSIDELAGYLGTWSAVRRYVAARGADPVSPFIAGIRPRWGDARRAVRWPLTLLAGRVT